MEGEVLLERLPRGAGDEVDRQGRGPPPESGALWPASEVLLVAVKSIRSTVAWNQCCAVHMAEREKA